MKASRPLDIDPRGAAMSLAVIAATVLAPTAARAQATAPSGEAAAPASPAIDPKRLEAGRARFVEGIALEKQERWADALERFREAGEVKTTSRILFHIGLCHEHLGQLPDALTTFEAAWELAAAEGAGDVVKALPSHLERLRAELARVVVRIEGAPEADAVGRIDGRVVKLGTVVGLAPGQHRVDAEVPGKVPVSLDFTVSRGAERTLSLVVGRREAPATVAPHVQPAGESGLGTVPTAGLVAAGAGALTLGAAAVLFVMRGSALDDVRAGCDGALSGCPEAARSDFERGQTYTTVGNVLLGVGAAGVAAGAVMFLVGKPSATPAGNRTGLAPVAAGADAGASLWRSW